MVSSGDLRTPQFNGVNYDFWAVKMETILIAFDLWDVVEFCMKSGSSVKEEESEKEDKKNDETKSKDGETESSIAEEAVFRENKIRNVKALSLIQGALTDELFPRIRNENTAQGAWNVLKREYRGDKKVRVVKLQVERA